MRRVFTQYLFTFVIAFLTDWVFGFGIGFAVCGGDFSKNGLFSGRPKFFGRYCSKSVPGKLDIVSKYSLFVNFGQF